MIYIVSVALNQLVPLLFVIFLIQVDLFQIQDVVMLHALLHQVIKSNYHCTWQNHKLLFPIERYKISNTIYIQKIVKS